MQFTKRHIKPEMHDLFDKYPRIFGPSAFIKQFYKGQIESGEVKPEDLCSLRFGFEHRAGWKAILDEFCADIDWLMEKEPDYSMDFIICKEKFGTLRFQGGPHFKNKHAQGLYLSRVYSLENASSRTCEITGEYGTLRDDLGWWQTLCDEEYKKQLKKNENQSW